MPKLQLRSATLTEFCTQPAAGIACRWEAQVQFLEAAAGDGDGPKTPQMFIEAYNGGAMRLDGWKFPVVVETKGVVLAAPALPIYATHTETIENLLGQTRRCSTGGGKIRAEADLTGGLSATCQQIRDHARNGFKWQASIKGQPTKIDFLPEGQTTTVNDRPVMGPLVIARATTLTHIALVPLGADTSSAVSIAAQAAQENHAMDFAKWLQAKYHLDATTLNAEQKTAFEAEFAAATTDPQPPAAPPVVAAPAADPQVIEAHIARMRAAEAAEATRCAEIRALQAEFANVPDCGKLCLAAIASGESRQDLELKLLRASRIPDPASTGGLPNIIAGTALPTDGLGGYTPVSARRGGRWECERGPITNDACRVIEAAALMCCGQSRSGQSWGEILAKHPQYGERCVSVAESTMHRFGTGLGPLGVMRLAARFAGMYDLPHNPADCYDRIIQAEFTTFALPVILSNLQNKLLLDGYNSVDPNAGVDSGVAWHAFVRRGPVNDFKPHFRVRLIGNHQPKPLGPAGEFSHGQMGEQTYKVQADVKGLMTGIPYQAIINDDLSAFSSIPTMCGVGCGEAVAYDIYTAFLANLQSDGSTAFFSKSDALTATNMKNLAAFKANWLGASTQALSFNALSTAVGQFLLQVKPNGAPLGILPAIMLAPVGLRTIALQLYQSTDLIPAIVATSGTPTVQSGKNIHAGLYRPVISQYLSNATITNNSATSWYLTTSPNSDVYAIEAAFLNGQEQPIIERDDMSFDRLGIGFRWWLSYGVGMGEPRAAQRNDIS